MGRNTFAFSNVVNVEEVDDFFFKFEERIHPFDDVQYWSCYVERRDHYVVERESYDPDYPKLRNVKGMVQFGMKQELPDVKRWFLSVFGKMLCMHLFVLPVLDVDKLYSFVKGQKEDLGTARVCVIGKLKEYDEEEEPQPSPKRVCTVETHTESIVTVQKAPLHPPMPTIPEKTSTIPTDGLLGLQ